MKREFPTKYWKSVFVEIHFMCLSFWLFTLPSTIFFEYNFLCLTWLFNLGTFALPQLFDASLYVVPVLHHSTTPESTTFTYKFGVMFGVLPILHVRNGDMKKVSNHHLQLQHGTTEWLSENYCTSMKQWKNSLYKHLWTVICHASC